MNNEQMLIGANIADLHFGAFNPKEQYETLKTQFIDIIAQFKKLDYILIAGDIYHHKLISLLY